MSKKVNYRGETPKDGETAQEFFDRTAQDRAEKTEEEYDADRKSFQKKEFDIGLAAVMAEAAKGAGPEAPLHEQGMDQAVALERQARVLSEKLERDGLEEEGPDESDVERLASNAKMLRRSADIEASRAAKKYRNDHPEQDI
jgi:hypothetical protein